MSRWEVAPEGRLRQVRPGQHLIDEAKIILFARQVDVELVLIGVDLDDVLADQDEHALAAAQGRALLELQRQGGTGGDVRPGLLCKAKKKRFFGWSWEREKRETLFADLCTSCGTVKRLYVKDPKRDWVV